MSSFDQGLFQGVQLSLQNQQFAARQKILEEQQRLKSGDLERERDLFDIQIRQAGQDLLTSQNENFGDIIERANKARQDKATLEETISRTQRLDFQISQQEIEGEQKARAALDVSNQAQAEVAGKKLKNVTDVIAGLEDLSPFARAQRVETLIQLNPDTPLSRTLVDLRPHLDTMFAAEPTRDEMFLQAWQFMSIESKADFQAALSGIPTTSLGGFSLDKEATEAIRIPVLQGLTAKRFSKTIEASFRGDLATQQTARNTQKEFRRLEDLIERLNVGGQTEGQVKTNNRRIENLAQAIRGRIRVPKGKERSNDDALNLNVLLDTFPKAAAVLNSLEARAKALPQTPTLQRRTQQLPRRTKTVPTRPQFPSGGTSPRKATPRKPLPPQDQLDLLLRSLRQ